MMLVAEFAASATVLQSGTTLRFVHEASNVFLRSLFLAMRTRITSQGIIPNFFHNSTLMFATVFKQFAGFPTSAERQ